MTNAKLTVQIRCVLSSVADPVHFFSDHGSGYADPVLKLRIRIRILLSTYLDMFLMFSKINICYGIFLPNLNIL